MKVSSLPTSLSASQSATSTALLPRIEAELDNSVETASTLVLESEEPSVPENSQACEAQKTQQRAEWAVFASTFVTIFLAEIGDKTQLTTLLMAAESHAPWIVFAGAGTALVTTSLLGVLLGQWLSSRIAPKTLERAAGASLLLIAATLLWDVLH